MCFFLKFIDKNKVHPSRYSPRPTKTKTIVTNGVRFERKNTLLSN